MTICFESRKMIKWKNLSNNEWRFLAFGHLPDFQKLLNNSVIDEMRNNDDEFKKFRRLYKFRIVENSYRYKITDYFNFTMEDSDILRMDKTTYFIDHTRPEIRVIPKIKTFVMLRLKCFTLKDQDPTLVSVAKITPHTWGTFLAEFHHPQTLLTELFIYITADHLKVIPGSFVPRAVGLPETSAYYNKISYDMFYTSLLESPYKTDCRTYPRNITQNECRHDCIKQESIARLSRIPAICSINREDFNYTFLTENSTKDEIGADLYKQHMPNGYNSYIDNLKDICYKKCDKRECETTLYIPRVEKQIKDRRPDLAKIFLMLTPKVPAIYSTSQEAIPLVTFLTNIVSSIGFWLGVSVYASIVHIVKVTWRSLDQARIRAKRKTEKARTQVQLLKTSNRRVMIGETRRRKRPLFVQTLQ